MKEKKISTRVIAIFMAALIAGLTATCFYLKSPTYIEPVWVKQPWETDR